jgi:hypothetical protein
MDLGMFDIFSPGLKTRALIDERRLDMSRSDKNSEKYVIPMHRKNVWTNKWMQDPRNNLLQVSSYDPSAQYRISWRSFKRKIGLTLYYSCRRLGHIAKECPRRRPSCLCCKDMDHEVFDFPRMIAKLKGMNLVSNISCPGHKSIQVCKSQEKRPSAAHRRSPFRA